MKTRSDFMRTEDDQRLRSTQIVWMNVLRLEIATSHSDLTARGISSELGAELPLGEAVLFDLAVERAGADV